MAFYESEQEQLDAIKKWWKENGASVLTGIALGLALLFGWRGWQGYTNTRAELASGLYEQVLMNLEQNKAEPARQVANTLLSEHSGSPYAVLAQLNLAAQDLKEGNTKSSHARLQWVIDRNTLPEVTHIARLRKIKLFLSEPNLEEAKKLLVGVTDKGRFTSSYSELAGDIALAQQQPEVARAAYEEALKGSDELLSSQERELVQMKLDSLGVKKEGVMEARLPVALPTETKTTTDSKKTVDAPATTDSAKATAVVPTESTPTANAPVIVTTPQPATTNQETPPVVNNIGSATAPNEPLVTPPLTPPPVATETPPEAPPETPANLAPASSNAGSVVTPNNSAPVKPNITPPPSMEIQTMPEQSVPQNVPPSGPGSPQNSLGTPPPVPQPNNKSQ